MGVKKFIWDELSDNVLLETDENDVVTAAYHHRPERFGELLSQNRSGVDRFFHFDGQHSTSDLTASNEKVTDTFSFTAYGEEVTRTGNTTNPFGYKGAVGYHTNEETHDVYVRNRTYEPAAGRWLSADPLGFIDGPNLFRAYFVPSAVDPAGTMVVSLDPNDQKMGTLACNDTAKQKFRFTWDPRTEVLSVRPPIVQTVTTAPCTGYIVQKVEISCRRDNCSVAECKQCKVIDTGNTKVFYYFEALKVTKGQAFAIDPAQFGPPPDNTHGILKSDGEAKFFCMKKDHDRWGNQRDDFVLPGNWNLDRTFKTRCGPIGTHVWHGGPEDEKEPDWWHHPSGEFSTNRVFAANWFCCDECDNNHFTTTASVS